MRHLRVAAAWQQGLPSPGADPSASSWRFDAACATSDPDLFFPVGSTGTALRQAERAKQVCAGCPVRLQCLEWALETDQPHGVWGGTDEVERARMAERRYRRAGIEAPTELGGRRDGDTITPQSDVPLRARSA